MLGRSVSVADRGSAAVEFIVMGVGLLVPAMYLGLAAASVQSGVYASTQSVREAARAFVTAESPAEGFARATTAAQLAFDDHGIDLPPKALTITCSSLPCLSPGSTVDVRVQWEAPLPWLPEAWAGAVPTLIPITAEHRMPVDSYRGDQA